MTSAVHRHSCSRSMSIGQLIVIHEVSELPEFSILSTFHLISTMIRVPGLSCGLVDYYCSRLFELASRVFVLQFIALH